MGRVLLRACRTYPGVAAGKSKLTILAIPKPALMRLARRPRCFVSSMLQWLQQYLVFSCVSSASPPEADMSPFDRQQIPLLLA